MIRYGIRALLLASVFALPAMAQAPQPLDTDDPIVASVDGAPIRRSDVIAVQRTLPPQFQQVPVEVLYPAVLERLIDAKLLANAGRKESLDKDPEVKQRLAQFEERLIQEVYLTRRIEAAVNDKAIRERYDQYVKSNPAKEEVRARHILVSTEAQAKDVIAELKKGADFADLAKAKSIDPAGKQQGGDLGYFSREEMVPEFSEAAFKLKEGEITEMPVKSQFGWHVIKVEARRKSTPAFEEMRDQLAEEIQQETVNQIVAQLRSGAKIERFNPDGSSAPAGNATPPR